MDDDMNMQIDPVMMPGTPAPQNSAGQMQQELDQISVSEQEEAKKAAAQLAPPKRKMIDLFLDDNDINEKSIIGFISFALMTVFGITDLVTALLWDMDLKVSETIYTSFVVVTLGAFGISEAGKAFGKD